MTDGLGGRSWTFEDVGRLTNPQLAILAAEGEDPRVKVPRTEAEFLDRLAEAAQAMGVELDG